MKTAIAVVTAVVLLSAHAVLGKNAADYQVGTYLGSGLAADGTYTNNVQCHDNIAVGFTCSGDSGFNHVALYKMKTNDGVWTLETYRQAEDTTARKWIGDPVHFKKEKPNLLDALKPGDRVMFRVEYHRKLNGTEKDVFIPKADDPNKEEKFIGSFLPAVVPSVPQKPTDNVKAMCDSGKLTPELQARYCQQQTQAQNQVGSENTGSFFPGQGSSQGSTTTREDPGPQVAGDGSIGVSSDENPKVRHDGVSISRIAPGGPANRAGIQAGDVILAIDDHYLFTAEELTQEIRGRKPGTRVAIRYRRHATIYDTYLIIGHADSKQ